MLQTITEKRYASVILDTFFFNKHITWLHIQYTINTEWLLAKFNDTSVISVLIVHKSVTMPNSEWNLSLLALTKLPPLKKFHYVNADMKHGTMFLETNICSFALNVQCKFSWTFPVPECVMKQVCASDHEIMMAVRSWLTKFQTH